MNTRFDDIARIIGSPLSRREACKNIGRVLLGMGVTALGVPRRAWADVTTCPAGSQRTFCGSGLDNKVFVCCPPNKGGVTPVVAPFGCCPANEPQCCPNVGQGAAATVTGHNGCCPNNTTCCPSGATTPCCGDANGPGTCCTQRRALQPCCPGGTACCTDGDAVPCCPAAGLPAANTLCCPNGYQQACCPAASTCCKNAPTACCPGGGTCCHDTQLVTPKQDCCPKDKPICCAAEANAACCPKDSQCCTPGQSAAECCPVNTDCCKDQSAKIPGCCPKEGAWNIDGGGTYLAKSAIRVSLLGVADAHNATSFSDATDIAGTLVAFNYATRAQIQSVSFSFVQGELLDDGNLVVAGNGLATVNGLFTNIEFIGSKTGDVELFEIFNSDTGVLLAGGTGEPGRANLSLTIAP